MTAPHGTHNRYVDKDNGCRCDECRKAHADYTRARRQQALADEQLTHGRSSTYDAGCRCLACKEARRIKYRRIDAPRAGRTATEQVAA